MPGKEELLLLLEDINRYNTFEVFGNDFEWSNNRESRKFKLEYLQKSIDNGASVHFTPNWSLPERYRREHAIHLDVRINGNGLEVKSYHPQNFYSGKCTEPVFSGLAQVVERYTTIVDHKK